MARAWHILKYTENVLLDNLKIVIFYPNFTDCYTARYLIVADKFAVILKLLPVKILETKCSLMKPFPECFFFFMLLIFSFFVPFINWEQIRKRVEENTLVVS